MALNTPAPSIVDFINSRSYLGLPLRYPPINLYPKQMEVLTEFYDKSLRELVLVWGRRTGKDFLTAIIAAYEAHKLAAEDRSNYSGQSFPIILIVTHSTSAARIILNELNSILPKHFSYSLSNDTIIMLINGKGVQVKIVSAASKSVEGHNVYSAIFNECANYKNDMGNIWKTLEPSVSENKGRMFAISSPRSENTFFHYLATAPRARNFVSQAATWEVNHRHTREVLLQSHVGSPEVFAREYEASFLKTDDCMMEQVTLRIPTIQIEKMKRMARKRAYQQDKDVSYTDVMRQMVEEGLEDWDV